MRKLFLIFAILIAHITSGQDYEVQRESHQLIQTRNVYLNGGVRASFGGKSRTYIKIDLPPNTKHWYYSFATTKGKSGIKNLNLAIQISSLLADPSNLTSAITNEIKVPEGSGSVDVYLCNDKNIRLFMNKVDNAGGTYSYIMEGTVNNTKQAVVEINDVTENTWYLGLKNPSELDGINVSIEVVAVTETSVTIEKSVEQEKAELYGGLGWSQFENGNYKKCVEYCDKANLKYKLGWVNANKGLALLVLGEEDIAMETYIEAIPLIKKQPNPDYVFKEVIKDINNALKKNPQIKGANEIKELLELQ